MQPKVAEKSVFTDIYLIGPWAPFYYGLVCINASWLANLKKPSKPLEIQQCTSTLLNLFLLIEV